MKNHYNVLETVVEDERHVCREMIVIEEKLDHRVLVLEEEVESLQDQNIELRQQLNKITEELNCVIALLNNRYGIEN